MIFHQLQLMVCAVLAQRYARRPMHPEAIEDGAVPAGTAPAAKAGTAPAK
jgi:sodium/bile acid cotransporter 7